MCVTGCLGAFFTGGCVLVLALTLVTLKVPLKVQTNTSVPNKSPTVLLCVQLVRPCMHVALCATVYTCVRLHESLSSSVFQCNVTGDTSCVN